MKIQCISYAIKNSIKKSAHVFILNYWQMMMTKKVNLPKVRCYIYCSLKAKQISYHETDKLMTYHINFCLHNEPSLWRQSFYFNVMFIQFKYVCIIYVCNYMHSITIKIKFKFKIQKFEIQSFAKYDTFTIIFNIKNFTIQTYIIF